LCAARMRHRPLEPLMQLTNDFPNLSQPQPGKTILTQLREGVQQSQLQSHSEHLQAVIEAMKPVSFGKYVYSG